MKVSATKFIIVFLALAFVFQFITNSILGPEVSLFPRDGKWYPGSDAAVEWKRTVAAVTYPIRYVMIEPLAFLGQDPDPAPPVLLIAFALYWAIIGAALYYLLRLIFIRKP